MTDAHKAALAEGRAQGRAVRAYLEAIAATKPTRGRKRTPDSMRSRLAVIDTTIEDADPTEVVLEMTRAEQTLQVAQATGARLIQQSLLNFIR